MVTRHMIIRMSIGVIPNDRNTQLGESTVIATSHRIVPCTVVRLQLQAESFDIFLQPVAECLISSCVEVNEMLRLGFVVVAANHVVVQVPLHLIDFRV